MFSVTRLRAFDAVVMRARAASGQDSEWRTLDGVLREDPRREDLLTASCIIERFDAETLAAS